MRNVHDPCSARAQAVVISDTEIARLCLLTGGVLCDNAMYLL